MYNVPEEWDLVYERHGSDWPRLDEEEHRDDQRDRRGGGLMGRPLTHLEEELTAALGQSMDREAELQEKLRNVKAERDRLKEACAEFRDSILHQRHQLEEPCLDNDQTNAVLGLFDDTIGQAITGE
jgi:hypothetical protein